MKLTELTRLTRAKEVLENSIKYLDESDKEIVSTIINKYNESINNHNFKTLTVLDPTKRELGVIKQGRDRSIMSRVFKELSIFHKNKFDEARRIRSNYIDEQLELGVDWKDIDEDSIEYPWMAWEEYRDATILISEWETPQWYIDAKILLKRQTGGYYEYDDLAKETNEIIKNQLAEEFIEENIKEVKQIKNRYETSKQQKSSSISL
jgi:hypothetical protein